MGFLVYFVNAMKFQHGITRFNLIKINIINMNHSSGSFQNAVTLNTSGSYPDTTVLFSDNMQHICTQQMARQNSSVNMLCILTNGPSTREENHYGMNSSQYLVISLLLFIWLWGGMI